MKRVKFMLTAIIVVAGLCGAYAFKASKQSTIFCSTVQNSTGANCLTVSNATYEETTDLDFTQFCTDDPVVATRVCGTRSKITFLP